MSSNSSSRRGNQARHGTARLPSAAGYQDEPLVYSSLSFDLWAMPALTGRYVQRGKKLFELWSPNSRQLPFLPGERLEDVAPSLHEEPTQRRFDGHTGKFDCLYAPQYFQPGRAHWAFMRRPLLVTHADAAYDAYRPLTEVWICHPSDFTLGRLPAAFIEGLRTVLRRFNREMEQLRAVQEPSAWDSRPDYATEDRLQALGGMVVWSEAVDYRVAFQRGLREKEAWIALSRERKSNRHWGSAALKDGARKAEAADDRYIGLWINGASEDVYLSYLLSRVPCFVAHEFLDARYTPTAVSPLPPTYHNFVDGTDIGNVFLHNAYEVAAREDPQALKAAFMWMDGRAHKVRPSRQANCERSSSMHCSMLETPAPSLPSASGHASPPPAPVRAASSTSYRPPSPPPRSPPRPVHSAPTPSAEPARKAVRTHKPAARSNPAAQPPVPPAPDAERNRYLAPEIERKRVDPARAEWVVLPPVARANKKTGGRYELDDYNGQAAWIYRGTRAKVAGSSTWYDREYGRRLHFGRYKTGEGVLDDDVFGAPVPRFPFFIMDGEIARPQRASHWMYRTQEPARGEAGRQAPTPPPTRLPWAPGYGPSAKQGDDRKGKGKGKGADEPDDDDDDDSDDGMDVDYAAPVPAATNVVVVDGVDQALSAVAFEALARDALHQSGAKPLVIVHARGRMWLRMEDAAAGQRALGGLRSLGPGLSLSYRANEDFDEETGYTTDMWLRQAEITERLEYARVPDSGRASAPRGAAAHEASESEPLPSPVPEDLSVSASGDLLAGLSMDEDVLGTFLATMSVPRHLLLKVSSSPSPPLEVVVPGIKVPHLIVPPPLSPSPTPPPQTPPAPPTERRTVRPLPTAPRAMRRPLTERLASPPGPRSAPRPSLGDRLTEPPVPLAQCLSNPPLATRIGNPPLRDRMGPLPPGDSASRKRAHEDLGEDSPSPEAPAPKKKKTRGLRSGKGEQTKRRAKARRAAREAAEVQEEGAGAGESQAAATSGSSQAVASGSNVRLEDLEDGELEDLEDGDLEDSGFWEDRYEQE